MKSTVIIAAGKENTKQLRSGMGLVLREVHMGLHVLLEPHLIHTWPSQSHWRLQPIERTLELQIPKALVQIFIPYLGMAEKYKQVSHCPLYWWVSSIQRNRTEKQKMQHFPWKQRLTPARCVPLSVWHTWGWRCPALRATCGAERSLCVPRVHAG